MAVLSANTLRATKGTGPQRYIVKSGSTVYVGSHVCFETSSGHIKPMVTGAGVKYIGIATEKVVGDGVLDCLVNIEPQVLHKVAVTGVTAVTDIKKLVYLSNDNDLTLTRPGATTNPVGYILWWYSSTSCDVRLFSADEIQILEDSDSFLGIIVLVDQAANADADGEFQRNGSNISFHDGTTERKVVLDTLTQTLTNKTLTSPTLTTPKIVTTGYIADAGGDEYLVFTEAATPITYIGITSGNTGVAPRVQGAGETNTDLHLLGSGTGKVSVSDGTDPTKNLKFDLAGATTAKTMTITSSQTLDRTLTLPDATDTLVGKATTDTLTNKTLSGVTIADATNVVLSGTTGTKIGTATTQKLGFYNATPVVQQTAVSAAVTTLTQAGTPSDYAIQALTNTGPFGFVTAAEGESVISVALNNQARIAEIITKLQALGLFA